MSYIMQINNNEDLISLAQRLVKDGPHSSETTPRRIRGLLGGTWAFDTIGAKYIWEHAYYPYFYIPRDDFIGDNLVLRGDKSKVPDASAFWLASLKGGRDARTNRVIVFADDAPHGLEAFVRVEHAAIDWFVEDEKLLGPHPKDPYKRVECIPSSRTIRVEINGTKVAESSNNVFLFETLLRPRYYLDAAAIEYGLLTASETVSSCPYKGTANYYNIEIEGKVIEDAVWYYRYPTSESARVQGRLCFYNEREGIDIFIDGRAEEKYADARLAA